MVWFAFGLPLDLFQAIHAYLSPGSPSGYKGLLRTLLKAGMPFSTESLSVTVWLQRIYKRRRTQKGHPKRPTQTTKSSKDAKRLTSNAFRSFNGHTILENWFLTLLFLHFIVDTCAGAYLNGLSLRLFLKQNLKNNNKFFSKKNFANKNSHSIESIGNQWRWTHSFDSRIPPLVSLMTGRDCKLFCCSTEGHARAGRSSYYSPGSMLVRGRCTGLNDFSNFD